MKKYLLLFLIFVSYGAYCTDNGLWYGKKQFETAKSLAMGGAQNVGANRNEGAYMNPATLITRDKKYIMSFDTEYSNSDTPTQFMLSVVDSRTSVLAGGTYLNYYSFTRKEDGKDVNYSTLQIGLSYAYPVFGGLVIGIGGRYLKYKKNDTNYINTFTFDLGATYNFSQYVKIGVVGYNLSNNGYIETPLKVAGGISVGDENLFLLNFDVVANFSAPDKYNSSESALYEYHTGVEFMPTEGFSILGGYEINKVLDKNYWSIGTQLFIPESRVETVLGYKQTTSESSEKYFDFSLKLYF